MSMSNHNRIRVLTSMVHGDCSCHECSALKGAIAVMAVTDLVADTLIVAANNPVSHGGLEGLRQIMLKQAARLKGE